MHPVKTVIFAAFVALATASNISIGSAQITANVNTSANQPAVDRGQLQRLRCGTNPRACASDQRTQPPIRRDAGGPKRNTQPGGQARP